MPLFCFRIHKEKYTIVIKTDVKKVKSLYQISFLQTENRNIDVLYERNILPSKTKVKMSISKVM